MGASAEGAHAGARQKKGSSHHLGEAFAPKQSSTNFSTEDNAYRRSQSGAQESIFLANKTAAELSQIHGHDLTRIGCGKSNLFTLGGAASKLGHEEAFAR